MASAVLVTLVPRRRTLGSLLALVLASCPYAQALTSAVWALRPAAALGSGLRLVLRQLSSLVNNTHAGNAPNVPARAVGVGFHARPHVGYSPNAGRPLQWFLPRRVSHARAVNRAGDGLWCIDQRRAGMEARPYSALFRVPPGPARVGSILFSPPPAGG